MARPLRDPKIVGAAYHRNGVGGAGFYVAIVKGRLEGEKGKREFLVTWFPENDGRGGQSQIAALDLEHIAAHNISMHPQQGMPGGAAWRCQDLFEDLLPEIEQMAHTR